MNSLFRVSERHHSGLILMTELAVLFDSEQYASLSEIAECMSISAGYLEEIAQRLKEAGLIVGRKGPGGGYRLTRPPAEISAGDIIEAIEGPISLVACQAGVACPVEARCHSRQLWSGLQAKLVASLNETTLASIAMSV